MLSKLNLAEAAFQDFDFGDMVVKDANGWEPGEEYRRTVFLEPYPAGGESTKVTFVVKFVGSLGVGRVEG